MLELVVFVSTVALVYIIGHTVGWIDAINAFGLKKEEKKVVRTELNDYSHLKRIAIQKGLYDPASMRTRSLDDELKIYDSEIKDDQYFIEKD